MFLIKLPIGKLEPSKQKYNKVSFLKLLAGRTKEKSVTNLLCYCSQRIEEENKKKKIMEHGKWKRICIKQMVTAGHFEDYLLLFDLL